MHEPTTTPSSGTTLNDLHYNRELEHLGQEWCRGWQEAGSKVGVGITCSGEGGERGTGGTTTATGGGEPIQSGPLEQPGTGTGATTTATGGGEPIQ
jgi:hypothetical protein